MALLKEDGSLDIERINRLPIDEYMKEIGNLTEEQYKEYCLKTPINEMKSEYKPNFVNCTMEEYVAKYGLVKAEDLIK